MGTPHRGSSFMDWCRDSLGVGHIANYARDEHHDIVLSAFDKTDWGKGKRLSSIRVLNPPAFTNLTTDYCRAFNKMTIDSPDVYYSSYAAVTEVPITVPLYFSYRVILEREGPNDGLVSLSSAKWGDFKGTVNCDHWQLIPPHLRGVLPLSQPTFDSVEFYLSVATELAEKGY